MSKSIERDLKTEDREALRDLLSQHIVRVRRREHRLSDAEAEALFVAAAEESQRPQIDGVVHDRLWILLSYCPPLPKIRKVALMLLNSPGYGNRGESMRYMLHAYPEERENLIEEHDQDEDIRVQNAIALVEAETDRPAAIKRWESMLGMDDLPHDLAETIPDEIAYAYEEDELAGAVEDYRDRDAQMGGGTVWVLVERAIQRRRFGSGPA